MHDLIVNLHSYNRYLILAALLFVLYRSYSGWLGKKSYEKPDNIGGAALLGLSHLQLLLGLILYFFVSTWTTTAFSNMAVAMKSEWHRYFVAEHIIAMLAAVTILQLGRIATKNADEPEQKHRKTAIYVTIAALIIISTLAMKGLLIGSVSPNAQ